MVARSVSHRLRKKRLVSPNSFSETLFYSICSTSRHPIRPISVVLDPNPKLVFSSWLSVFHSSSSLIRPSHGPVVSFLEPSGKVDFSVVVTMPVSTFTPPATPSSKSIKKARKKKKSKPTVIDLTVSPPQPSPIPENVLKLERKAAATALFSKIHNKTCVFHVCSPKHRCPRAPPWPSSCVVCGEPCRLRALVCSGCGVVTCYIHEYAGVCPHPDL